MDVACYMIYMTAQINIDTLLHAYTNINIPLKFRGETDCGFHEDLDMISVLMNQEQD